MRQFGIYRRGWRGCGSRSLGCEGTGVLVRVGVGRSTRTCCVGVGGCNGCLILEWSFWCVRVKA